tara:strand:+ start:537 stop:659 length:123 start_codon:yes stop_codon:yes gene_type:complete
MVVWYIMVEDIESGRAIKLTDLPKDIDERITELVKDMEGN